MDSTSEIKAISSCINLSSTPIKEFLKSGPCNRWSFGICIFDSTVEDNSGLIGFRGVEHVRDDVANTIPCHQHDLVNCLEPFHSNLWRGNSQ